MSLLVVVVASSFSVGCRLVVEDGVTGRSDACLTSSFLGVGSAILLFLRPVVLALGVTGATTSGAGFGFFSSDFSLGGSTATSLDFLIASPSVFGFWMVAFVADSPLVSGGAIVVLSSGGFVDSRLSLFCLLSFVFVGETARLGVMGTTGTTGVMVDDAARDIVRDSGRDRVSSPTALGMAGTVNPGGMDGVARRGCSKSWVSDEPRTGSQSSSLTSASTLNSA